MNQMPLVVHLIYRLDFGGLETLLAECVNRMPPNKYRHAVVCLTGYTDFAKTINAPGVRIYALNKPPGLAPQTHVKLWKLLRYLRPSILHTYNLAAVEYGMTAALAGVPVRIHAEHGRDASDPDGKNPKHKLLRKLVAPFIDAFVPVSGDLQQWLRSVVGISEKKIVFISNGVDTNRFKPGKQPVADTSSDSSALDGKFVIGTVGRVQDVKNHHGLIDAFLKLRKLLPAEAADELRLVIIGDGPLLPSIRARVAEEGIASQVWLPGARTDVAQLMQSFSVFTLPSIAEGTPVTILEAMACGLAVVATRVGGIPEVVVDGTTGMLVPPNDPDKLAAALLSYYQDPARAQRHGAAGRTSVENKSSIHAMVAAYASLYDILCQKKISSTEPIKSCAE